MKRRYTITLPGDPVPKGRPRVYKGHAVTPPRTTHAENRVFNEFRTKYPDATPFKGPVNVYAEFWMSRRGRPDLDNLLKLVLDALNAVAYLDDSQIIQLAALKRVPDPLVPAKRGGWRKRKPGDPYLWHGDPYEPHLTVIISELDEWEPA